VAVPLTPKTPALGERAPIVAYTGVNDTRSRYSFFPTKRICFSQPFLTLSLALENFHPIRVGNTVTALQLVGDSEEVKIEILRGAKDAEVIAET
jgi:hypothetical protein